MSTKRTPKSRKAFVIYTGDKLKYRINGKAVVVEVEINEYGVAQVLAPQEAVDLWRIIAQVTVEADWLECDGPAQILTDEQFKEFAWKLFVQRIFIIAALPEWNGENLPSGLLRNDEIANKFLDDRDSLFVLAEQAHEIADLQEKRRFMSEAANRNQQDADE